MSTSDDRTPGAATRSFTYRLSGDRQQQAVLDDFRTAALLGVHALGVEDAAGPRIVVRCETEDDAILVDHVVREIDPGASRVGRGAPLVTAPHGSEPTDLAP